MSHYHGADSGKPFDLASLVSGIQVEVHLVTGAYWRIGELKREIHVLSAKHPEVIVRIR